MPGVLRTPPKIWESQVILRYLLLRLPLAYNSHKDRLSCSFHRQKSPVHASLKALVLLILNLI